MNIRLMCSALVALPLVATSVLAQSADPHVVRINGARSAVGRPVLRPLPPELAARNGAYLRSLLATLLRTGTCDHDLPRWQAFQEAAQRWPLQPTSEVIACPRDRLRWDPDRIVGQWLASPLHAGILLNRPQASHVDCVMLEADERAAAACTLWSA